MDKYLKRKMPVSEANSDKKIKRDCCPHAQKCYRRNPHHFKEYDHPHLMQFIKQGDSFKLPEDYPQEYNVVKEQLQVLNMLLKASPILGNVPGTSTGISATTNLKIKNAESISPNNVLLMSEKLKRMEPYNIFFTKIPESLETHKQINCITFPDLVCPSLGALKCSLQINYMIDIMWLMEQYAVKRVAHLPLTVLYGFDFPNMKKYMDTKLPNVKHHRVQMKDPFGTHHTKMGIYCYEDNSLRVVISTANLYYEDWNHYNQGLWISPVCPQLADTASLDDGNGPTGFKSSLINYLNNYQLPLIQEWIDLIKRANFNDVRVFLITSVPGRHYPKNDGSHIYRLGYLLSRYCDLPEKTTPASEGPDSWSIIAQASTIGSLGKTCTEWFRNTFLKCLENYKKSSLQSVSQATLNVIFPSRENVLNSYYGADGGGCLPYSKNIHEKQKWLNLYLHQWKADKTHRSRAMPHIKSYCRISPCTTKLAWFLLTSANISKSAWGGSAGKNSSIYVRSYEAGVLFLPFCFSEDYFFIDGNTKKLFPFMYDLPLISYKSNDEPWCS